MGDVLGGSLARASSAFAFIRTLTVQAVKEFMDDNCMQLAAAISYYALFALFPLLIFVTGIMGIILNDSQLEQDLIDAIVDFIEVGEGSDRQNDIANAVRDISGSASGFVGLVGLVAAAWAGSNMFSIIRRSLNHAYDLEYHRPFVQQKLLDLTLVLGVGLFFLASIAATAFLRSVRTFSADLGPVGEFAEDAGFLWDAASLFIPFSLSFMAFLILYWIVPNQALHPGDVWPGALVAAVAFEVGKFGFSIYLETVGQNSAVFGALGGVAIFLFWVYVSANILLFGAEVASEYPRVRRGDYDKPEAVEEEKPPILERAWRLVKGLFVEERER
jgi:membrane protein